MWVPATTLSELSVNYTFPGFPEFLPTFEICLLIRFLQFFGSSFCGNLILSSSLDSNFSLNCTSIILVWIFFHLFLLFFIVKKAQKAKNWENEKFVCRAHLPQTFFSIRIHPYYPPPHITLLPIFYELDAIWILVLQNEV